MKNKNEQKAYKLLKALDAKQAFYEASIDELVWGESITEVTTERVRCIRVGTEEYNKIINK